MKRSHALVRLALIGATTLLLSGCVSLLPKAKPSDLYRFGQSAASGASSAAGTVGVFRAGGLFQRESAGDRLLTISEGKVAYVAETRWVAPAAVLWDAAVLSAFDSDPGPVRLMSRGEVGSAAYILRLDVRNFEARYVAGPKAAPTVVLRVRAVMSGGQDRAQVHEQIFEAQVKAGENRVGAIVPAYDKAVTDVLAEIVAWANERARPVA